MRLQLALACIVVAIAGSASAQSAKASSSVYLCTDADGHKEYRNTGITKGCKKVNLPGLTNVPSKRPPVKAENKKFPKVEKQAQKARDNDRKRILEDELKAEQDKLAKLKEEYKGGQPDRLGNEKNFAKYQERTSKMKEDIERSEKNVEALQREISKL